MAALLNNLSVRDHEDNIGIHNRRQAMTAQSISERNIKEFGRYSRNDKRCSAFA